MSQQLSSSSSFTVITIEDGVSVQAQYAPNSTPQPSQIHSTWQDGDLYMRTRETDGVWSDWHRIVGESGDETDYSFGISANKTTANADVPPSDISTWSDAPIAVTTEKPFLWSKVEKKTWDESTQQLVVESTRYIRLTGEDGNDGVSYIIESSVGSVTIASNKTSESISNVVFSFFKKEGDAQRVPYQCYCTVFRKKGSTYTMVRKYTTAGAAVTYSNDNITVANYDAIVVCIYNESSESHSDYLAEYQIPVWKHGDEPYFADLENEMDSIACDNVGHPSSVQSVNTSVSLFKGSSKLSSTIAVKDDSPSGTSYTNGVAKNGITVTWNNTTGAVDVSFSTDATVPEVKNFCIIVTSSDFGSTITKYLYFTVNGVRAAEQGDPAVLYRLVTNTNQIVKKKDGSYVPAIDTYVTCAVTKTVGSAESTPPATEYTLTYILNETGGEKTDYTDTKIKVQDVTKNVVFILRVSDVVVDRETVPLVSDGDNGTDAKDVEWVYIRTENNIPPDIYDDAHYTDHNNKTYSDDDHLPRVNGNGRTDIETNSGTTTYPECTNSPKGVTDVYKYEWEIKRTKGNAVGGSRSWLPYSGTMTLHNNLAESAFIIDLDNDNDQFGTDSESKVLTDQTRRTIATLYDGAEPQTLTELTVSLKYEDETTTVPSDVASYTTDVNTGAVAITIKQNLTTAFSHTEIKARITAKCAKGDKNAMFTIRKIMGGAPGLNPIIYQLSPKQSSFSFSRDANNALTPSARSSVINALKTEGNSTVPATAQDGLTYKWGWDESTTPIEEGKLIGTTITVSNTQAAEHNQVWVELSTGDRETIPIIKDGQHGESSWLADLDNEMDSVSCDDIGHPVSEQTVSTRISLYLGRTPKVFKITAITRNGSSNMGIGVTVDPVVSLTTERSTPTTFAVTYATTATISGKDDFAITIVAVDDDTVTRTLHFTVNGIKGDVYNLSPSTGNIVFSVDANDAYQPSTGYNVSCKVRKRGVNGGITDITTGLNNIDGNGMTLFFRWLNADGNQSDASGDTSGSHGTHWFIGYESTSPYGMVTKPVLPTTPLSAMEWCISTATNGDSVTDASIIDREVIPIIKSGKKGTRGKTGRFYYYAQEWSDSESVSYLVSDAQAPYFKYGYNYYVFNPEENGNYTMHDMGEPSSSSANWVLMNTEFKYIITEAIFGSFAHFGSFVISGDWLISVNGTLNGIAYTGSDLYDGSPAYTYFDSQYPLGTRNLGISATVSGTTSTQKGGSFYLKEKRVVKITGKVTSGTMYVVLCLASGSAISSPQEITSLDSQSVTINFSSVSDTNVCIKAYMSSSSSGVVGTILSASVETFAPTYAVDGLSGKSIQNAAIVKGTIHVNALFQNWQTPSWSSQTLNLNNGTAFDMLFGSSGSSVTYTLPNADTLPNVTLTMICYCEYRTRSAMYSPIIASEKIYTSTMGSNDRMIVSNFTMPFNRVVKIHSIGGKWILDCDETNMDFTPYTEN